jgi:hypothetical protein
MNGFIFRLQSEDIACETIAKVNPNTNKIDNFSASEVINYIEDHNIMKHKKLVTELYNIHDKNLALKKEVIEEHDLIQQQVKIDEHNLFILTHHVKNDTEKLLRKHGFLY